MGDTKSNHDSRISAVKAICIILMVVGHSGCPQQMSKWIYLFHMPCFFFISGFLMKDKYLTDLWTFIKHRFKGLWWPFVKWSLVFLALHNVLVVLHLYDTVYTWRDVADKTFHILTLTGSEQLLGGYWFLKELLYASIISILSLKLVSKVLPNVKAEGDFDGIISCWGLFVKHCPVQGTDHWQQDPVGGGLLHGRLFVQQIFVQP